MIKERSIERLKKGHEYLKKVISHLNNHQMTKENILNGWTIKDIISHLSAWNFEQAKAIDDLLAGCKPLWWGLDATEFNRREIKKRKAWNLEKVIIEWENSFEEMIKRVDKLSDKEWIHEVCEKEKENLPVNIDSMLSYEYRGEDHEGGHAKQIEEFFHSRK